MSNDRYSSNTGKAIRALEELLPRGWTLKQRAQPRLADGVDAIVEIVAPDKTKGTILVEAKSRLSARQAADLSVRLTTALESTGATAALIVTGYASELAQDRIRRAGLSYLDLTGNVRLSLERPGLFIQAQGATRDPSPPATGVRSLKGAKGARIVRALCDWRAPVGVRALANRAGTDPGYTSRVLKLLEQEDLVRRDSGGRITDVEWKGLLRRWSRDYDVGKSNRAVPYLSPRGLSAFTTGLRDYKGWYALTGQLAVPSPAQVTATPLASCYVNDADEAASKLDLRPTDAGANVILLEPFDEIVSSRVRTEDGLRYVALSQCAADLMTGTGREPSQAEALLEWMEANEDAWRA